MGAENAKTAMSAMAAAVAAPRPSREHVAHLRKFVGALDSFNPGSDFFTTMISGLWRRDPARLSDVGRFYDRAAIDPTNSMAFAPEGELITNSYEAAIALRTFGVACDVVHEQQGSRVANMVSNALGAGTGAWREILSLVYQMDYGVTGYYGRHKIRDAVIGKVMTGFGLACHNSGIVPSSQWVGYVTLAVFGEPGSEFAVDFANAHSRAQGGPIPRAPDGRRRVAQLFDIQELRHLW